MTSTQKVLDFYRDATVFLTGSTGGVGGCLLYKLALILPTSKIYVLIRGSEARAIARWRETLPNQVEDILAMKKLIFVIGDITKPNFGVSDDMLPELEREVTVVINSAANISLSDPLRKAVQENCLAPLELARMSSRFRHLKSFVQVSSAYVNANRPEGLLHEKIYPLEDAEAELAEIQRTGTTKHLKAFPSPYAYSKHIMERILLARYPHIPILIIRPSLIGPAVREPYEGYGPDGSMPVDTFLSRLFLQGKTQHWVVPSDRLSGSNLLDECPVDIMCNMLLHHIQLGTQGIVHAACLNYLHFTMDHLIKLARDNAPPEWLADMPAHVWTSDTAAKAGELSVFYKIATQEWVFLNRASQMVDFCEPLSLTLEGHDAEKFWMIRVRRAVEKARPMREKIERKRRTNLMKKLSEEMTQAKL
ncbi:hypothetical protein FIBSPDRAFT_862796 [Athelia psychrophila]|uniref:Fatty acyl-CoA reductase n=1 Tax=Athelia psychrophila TaxID=1759441 RepID=A0A166HYA5_9AGAM|nr:hypothetical protein FIBSPDRAFT_862796 [Fibularhizoctonia sp. CBS 109695]